MLEAVLPLVERDLGRAALLRESLDEHGAGIERIWVVTPKRDLAAIAAAFAGDERWRPVAEDEVLGRRRIRVVVFRERRRPRGGSWFLQQAIKLAACARSRADWVITLDADVIALRSIDEGSVAPGGRALSQMEPPPQEHPHWYDGAARVLGMPRSDSHNAVTPAVLSPEVCRDLIARLESRRGRLDRDWVAYLMHNAPWSEYSLYNTFLEGTGRFGDYHVRVDAPAIYGDAVWTAADLEGWRAGRVPGDPLFTLVQSTTGVPVDEVRRKLAEARSAG
jgi:hypothetical protein